MHTYHLDRLAADLAEVLGALGVTALAPWEGLHGLHDPPWPILAARSKRPVGRRASFSRDRRGQLGSRGLGRLLGNPAYKASSTNLIPHTRAGTDEVVSTPPRPVCGH